MLRFRSRGKAGSVLESKLDILCLCGPCRLALMLDQGHVPCEQFLSKTQSNMWTLSHPMSLHVLPLYFICYEVNMVLTSGGRACSAYLPACGIDLCWVPQRGLTPRSGRAQAMLKTSEVRVSAARSARNASRGVQVSAEKIERRSEKKKATWRKNERGRGVESPGA